MHNGLCVFEPHQGVRSMKSAQVISIRLDENAWIELQKTSMRPLEALWKEDYSPVRSPSPQGEGARYDNLFDGRMGSRPRPTNIARGITLLRSVTPIIFAIFHSRLCVFLKNKYKG